MVDHVLEEPGPVDRTVRCAKEPNGRRLTVYLDNLDPEATKQVRCERNSHLAKDAHAMARAAFGSRLKRMPSAEGVGAFSAHLFLV